MKKISFLLSVSFILGTATIIAQDTQNNNSNRTIEQLNFGLVGVSYEIPAAKNIAIVPFAGTDFDINYLILGVKGNYYFDNLINLHSDWDLYGGIGGGYAFGFESGHSSEFDGSLHVGGRWFWNDTWGVYLEFGGGNTTGATGGLGITMKL